MKAIAAIAIAGIVLSSCTTTGSIDTAIKNNLPRTCSLIETSYAAFSAAAVSGSIKASTVRKVDALYDGTRDICADPANVNAANALVLTASAFATISLALKEARAAEKG